MNFYRLKAQNILKRSFHLSSRKNGYIVLVPEIGEEDSSSDSEKNSLLTENGLPKFNNCTIENCMAAIGRQATELENSVNEMATAATSGAAENFNLFHHIENTLEPSKVRLETTWGIAKVLYLGNSSLMPTKSYVHIHDRAKNARAAIFSNKRIFDVISQPNFRIQDETPERKRLLEKFLLEGKLNGLSLSSDKLPLLHATVEKINTQKSLFDRNIRVATEKFSHTIRNYNLVRDFPQELLQDLAVDPSQSNEGPWRVTLQPKILGEYLEYCPDRIERWNLWQADVRKGSSQTEKSLDNSIVLEKIRDYRRTQAQILGYPDYTTMSMETKMIKNVENANRMFASLLEYAKPAQVNELKSLQDYASKNGFQDQLDLYDIGYWKRKFSNNLHGFDEVTLREYFPIQRVLSGLLDFCEELFGIEIVERKQVESWHSDVKFFDIFNQNGQNKEPLAGFYLDCFSRDKRFALNENSGWMVGIKNRCSITGTKPLCALIFNFEKPTSDRPYLLSQSDLRSLFENFGTAMQHLLTEANYSDLSGLSNIEWDASKISSQFLLNFLQDPDVIRDISGHYSTEEQIPDELINGIQGYRKLTAGYDLCRELYFADLDLTFHTSKDFWLDIVKQLWPKYLTTPLDKKDAHPCSMTKIFSGDWAAAQFSNTYSKLIAADIYQEFVDEKVKENNYKNASSRFRDTFIACGGSVKASEVFRRFRGRDPSPQPLLKSLGIANKEESS